ncbi:unnamed protein product [Laminaria digitata]
MTEVEEHNAALEKVTDFVEEKELDTEQTQNALSSLADPAQALLPANESSSEASIKISAADIELVTQELEITSEEARAALLKGHGDVVQALRHLLQLQL